MIISEFRISDCEFRIMSSGLPSFGLASVIDSFQPAAQLRDHEIRNSLHHLVSLDLSRKQCQANNAHDEQRKPRCPEGRLIQNDFASDSPVPGRNVSGSLDKRTEKPGRNILDERAQTNN